MDDLAIDTNLPIAADLLKCVVAFGDNVRRCCMYALCHRTTVMKLSELKLRWILLALCAVAAIRVFVFAAAFPFFNNVDEQAHVDLVFKYSHGNIPRGIEPFASEAASYLAIYSTPEYFIKPEQYGGQYPPPNWQISRNELQKILDREIPFWESRANHESGEPPLYYATAGAWMNFGRAFGLRELSLLYWVRFLNVALAAVLVWLGFAAARSTFPENHFLQLGVAALLTFWPQSAFYSIQGDALSPVCFGIAFLGLIQMLQRERVGIFLPIWTGVAVAATCLIKTSNLPLPLIATIILALKVFHNANKERLQAKSITLSIFVVSLSAPLAIWFAWNHQHFGDLTATKSKIELLGWTHKSLSEWLPHPIFTLHGFREFWPELSASFWRGEFVWHLEQMASPIADLFYSILTALVILAALVLLFRKQSKGERLILWLAFLSFLSIVAFLVVLSVSFDFDQCPYPSREHPYFTSGRLLNAAAVPFFLLFGYVIDRFANWKTRQWMRWTLLGAILLLMVVSQLQTNAPAFSSRYNFFHRKAL
jgi:multidrug transporter EmrE-like cation transporter